MSLNPNIEKLEKVAELVSWLDSARWSKENQSVTTVWDPQKLSSASDNALVHWITYITDIQRPWQRVWRVGGKVFTQIVRSFSEYDFPVSDDIFKTEVLVSNFLDTYKGKVESGKVRPFKHEKDQYSPRYSNQHEFIKRTLTILAHQFNKSFMQFIGESIKRWSSEKDALQRVARDLYFLTYSDYSIKKALGFFETGIYPHWKRFGYKRLWAALRDYRKSLKYLRVFNEGLKESMGESMGESLFKSWVSDENFSVKLLELPGDVWNIEFLKKVIRPWAEHCKIDIKKSWSASRVARKVYDFLGSRIFYPEQLDVSWDLSSKACENGICDICPFSSNDLRKSCIGNLTDAYERYCPIVLSTCQYRMVCNPERCPISKGKGIGVCDGVH